MTMNNPNRGCLFHFLLILNKMHAPMHNNYVLAAVIVEWL